MRFRSIPLLVACAIALCAAETTDAASLRVSAPRTSTRMENTPAERRAERIKARLQHRTATETRLQARPRARARARGTNAAPSTHSTMALRVLELTNAARKAEGLDPLALHPILERTAQAYAEGMATRGFFSHDDPEGGSSRDRILAGGYAKPTCDCSWTYGTGENLAQGQRTPEDVVKDWLTSPGHRANIMSVNFKDIGIGFFENHWVQHFGVSDVLLYNTR